jgi:NAD(P)-dependent dehydrogenase (short-subunit alcohol dehydrogenase family)
MGVLDGRRIVIVGASAGIGREVAMVAGKAGAEIAVVGRRLARLQEISDAVGRGHPIGADITDEAQCRRVVDEAAAALGTFDALIFCAGASALGLLTDTPQAEWRRIFDTNVTAPALIAAAAVPHMAERGVVAFLSSESVGRPRHGLVAYSASKAALEETIRGFAAEHPELRFSCICVGATLDTEFARDFDLDIAAELFPVWIAHGLMRSDFMPLAEVGQAVVDAVTSALLHPGIGIEHVSIRPPGGLMVGPVESLLERIPPQAAAQGS